MVRTKQYDKVILPQLDQSGSTLLYWSPEFVLAAAVVRMQQALIAQVALKYPQEPDQFRDLAPT